MRERDRRKRGELALSEGRKGFRVRVNVYGAKGKMCGDAASASKSERTLSRWVQEYTDGRQPQVKIRTTWRIDASLGEREDVWPEHGRAADAW